MSVVGDFCLVLVGTVVVASTWYGIEPRLTEARERRTARRVGRQTERDVRVGLRDHSTTPA